jgi:perosamine synthetase
MPKTISISLSPNTEPDDVRLAWRIFWSPKTWHNDSFVAALEEKLQAQINNQPVVATSSGRQALYQLLQAYNLGVGDEVILQAFTCLAVPASIIWAGAQPIYADIDPATYNLSVDTVRAHLTPRTKAVVVQHTFGLPGPVAALRTFCDQHGLILIEDCALALGGSSHQQPLGTFGHSAFFSFGRDKIISSVFGGAVTSSDAALIQKIRSLQQALPLPPTWWVRQQLFHPLASTTILPLYSFLHLGQALLILLQKINFLSKAYAPGERQGQAPPHLNWRFSPALAQIAAHQLTKLPRYNKQRQDFAEQYLTALSLQSGLTLPQPPPTSSPAWLRFPLQLVDRSPLLQAAKQNNIQLGDWYHAPLLPADANFKIFHYHAGSCPQAEQITHEIVNLPTHPRLKASDATRIIKLVKENT